MGLEMKFHFFASPTASAQEALDKLIKRYNQCAIENADIVVSLGGDGTAIDAIKMSITHKKPVYALNYGHVGHLTNHHQENEDLYDLVNKAEKIELSPLRVEVTDIHGDIKTAFGINEIHVCNRHRGRGIYLSVSIDGILRLPKLGADGLIVSTTLGSTGYNKSARGPILPLGDDLLSFTPNNAFNPDRLRSSVLRPAPIDIEVHEPEFRIADVYADSNEIMTNVRRVKIELSRAHPFSLLFDPRYSLTERIMRTQFPQPVT